MSKCKICEKENKNRTRVHICESCKTEQMKCSKCGGKKSKASYKLCSKCSHEDEKYKKKMSESCKGKTGWNKGLTKETDKRVANISKNKIGQSAWNKGLTKETDKRVAQYANAKIGDAPWNKGLNMSEEFCKKQQGRKHSKETKDKIRNALLKRIENGEINGTPKSKIYEYEGIKVQGGSELKWIKEFKDIVIKTKKKSVKTPDGLYFPDFETNDFLVEVKSQYTYEQMLNKKQFKKIKFTTKNIKPVKIYIDHGTSWEVIDAGVDWALEISKDLDK